MFNARSIVARCALLFLNLGILSCGAATGAPDAASYSIQNLLARANPSGILTKTNPVADRYLVVFHKIATPGIAEAAGDPATQTALAGVSEALALEYGATVQRHWTRALPGIVVKMDAATAADMAKDPRVAFIEQDGPIHAAQMQNTPLWGLDRIDQRDLPLDYSYNSPNGGAGVTAYVLDSGIRTTHEEFGGRAAWGINLTGDGRDTDCDGHGTGVASVIGGATHGVAKGVRLVAVKVLNCQGEGYLSDAISGIDWVIANRRSPAVLNISLRSEYSPAWNQAVEQAVQAGITVTVAAGNEDADACESSPASALAPLTVGAIDQDDARAPFSNWGGCLDLFAPGVAIPAAGRASNTSRVTLSGTSFAAPHVAGVAALYLHDHPEATTAEVATALLKNATPDQVTDAGLGSRNRLLFALTDDPLVELPVAPAGTEVFPENCAWPSGWTMVPGSVGQWYVETIYPLTEGGCSFASPYQTLGDNEYSAVEITNEFAQGEIAFDWTSAGESSDQLGFFVDYELIDIIDGCYPWSESCWHSVRHPISAGTHTLTWMYAKDVSLSLGWDQGILDNVVLPYSTPLPDLVITAVTAGASAQPGGTLAVSATTKNQGTAYADPSRSNFYLSADNIITQSDIAMDGWGYDVAGLAPEETGSATGTIEIPTGIAPGTYYLGNYADDRDEVTESDETNNGLAAATTTVILSSKVTLMVTKTGKGSGTVTSQPAGIDCGAICSAGFASGTVVTLTATAIGGSTFGGWNGAGCSGTGTCAVTMDAAKTVTATFTAPILKYALKVQKSGTGTGTVTSQPPGIDCGTDCTENYLSGTAVTLTATATGGSTFGGWSGAGCSGTGTCAVTMDAAKTVTATFAPISKYALKVQKSGTGTGTVTSDPPGIECGSDCTENYLSGTAVTLTASATGGSTFGGWSGAGCSGTGSCVVAMDAAKTVTATFKLKSYRLTVSKDGDGTGDVTSSDKGILCGTLCSATYQHGTLVTLAAQASPGSTFAGWSGADCTGTGTCAVTLDAAKTVTATFRLPVIEIKIGDVSKAEGKYAVTKFVDPVTHKVHTITSVLRFPVTLTPASAGTVTVRYATLGGTATEGVDYAKATGTLTFAPGVTARSIVVFVIGDPARENDEAFLVNLSAPAGASLSDAKGTGTIVNDD